MAAQSGRDPQLVNGEQVLWRMRPHWIILVGPTFWGAVSTGVFVAIMSGLNAMIPNRSGAPWVDWVLFCVYAIVLIKYTGTGYVDWLTTRYTFTNQRVITRTGLIVINGETLPLEKVHSIQFKKTLLERLFGSGSLTIESAAENEAIIKNVTRAEEVHKALYEQIASRGSSERRGHGEPGYSVDESGRMGRPDTGRIDFS